jgi:5'-methylthioadenosine phosphorylase
MKADIGVFGGSGFYSFLKNIHEVDIDTPYGKPSDKIALADYKGKSIAFLPRHGKKHTIPPHKINYLANLYSMKKLGVKKIIAPTASGSLQVNIKPGDFVICDQFIDRTNGRKDTFFEGPEVKHISAADPYCSYLRKIAVESGAKNNITIHDGGTVVVINGPRFSTRAESRWFSSHGWEVINMTQYPECFLARELGICYANIALITDYDAGIEDNPDIKPVTHEAVLEVFNKNNEKLKKMLFTIIENIDINHNECGCGCEQSSAIDNG